MTTATIHTHVIAGEALFTYVYIDPANPPTEIMLNWFDGGWEHRAYWGANTLNYGTDGTASRRYVGMVGRVDGAPRVRCLLAAGLV